MASISGRDSLKSLCECPICFEAYKDPRLLKCGHQFCEQCLKDILEHCPQRSIPCPVCREVTKPIAGDVKTLPRSTLHQHIQDLILQQPTQEALGQTCTKCKKNKPVKHCTECKSELAYLCEKCFLGHQKIPRFAKHKIVDFDPALVCTKHPLKMVELFCQDCISVICVECVFECHIEHKIEALDVAAEKSKTNLCKYVENQKNYSIDSGTTSQLKLTKSKLYEAKQFIRSKVDKIKETWKTLAHKLDSIVQSVQKLADSECEKIDGYLSKIKEVTNNQEKCLKLAENLLKPDTSDLQIILGSYDIPDICPDLPGIQVSIPQIPSVLDKMADTLHKLAAEVILTQEQCNFDAWKNEDTTKPWELNKKCEIKAAGSTKGLVWIKETGNLIVRVEDKEAPVQIYRPDGTIISKFGEGTIADWYGDCTQISYDPVRQLILIPCLDGSLMRMEMDGKMKDGTKLGEKLGDVCYLQSRDMYAVTDHYNGAVFLVSPDTMKTTQTIATAGTHRHPLHICAGFINDKETIVVSDFMQSEIILYHTDGEHVKTYGPEVGGLRKLNKQDGVSVDSRGRIVVCEIENNRVLGVWSDEDRDHWECLLDKEQLGGGMPWDVDINNKRRLMAVSGDYGNNIQIYGF